MRVNCKVTSTEQRPIVSTALLTEGHHLAQLFELEPRIRREDHSCTWSGVSQHSRTLHKTLQEDSS